jgi:small subunit ribosomal protein S1
MAERQNDQPEEQIQPQDNEVVSAPETEAIATDAAAPDAEPVQAPAAAEAPEAVAAEAAQPEEGGAVAVAEAPADDEAEAPAARPSRSERGTFMDERYLDEDEYSEDEYESMLDMYEETLTNIEEGEIVKARVLRVTDNAVILDVGFKSEGSVPRDEFKNPDLLQPGDEVDVFLENLEDQDGVVVLSKKKADFLRVWEKIKRAYEEDEEVPGTLVRKIKGGVTVDLMGVDAFLPGSQIALRRVPNVEDLLGQTFDFKIIKLNKRRRNIVVSRRVILETEREKKREQLVKELLVGQVRKGVVKNVTDFGAFIDLGGLDGLLHITDMSWGRVGHPSEIVGIGDELDVKVLDIDWNRERISLGLKQLLPYPWKDIERKYPVGARVRGKVVSITNYGAFVELEKGVEGLVHISEMSWTRNVKHPSKLVSIGDEIEAVILKVDRDDEKISLGMKQIEEDPWLALPVKYPVGTRVAGKVRNLTSFGAFVEIEPGIDGLIHISDLSWTRRVQHPSEVLRKNEDIEVLVLGVDPENKRISLGLKQTTEDPWAQISEEYTAGLDTSGTIVRLLDEGVVADLGNDLEGFIPVTHLSVPNLRDPADHFREGQPLDLRVLECDPVNRRIVLTVTNIPEWDAPPPTEEAAVAAGEEEGAADTVAEVAARAADEAADAPAPQPPAVEATAGAEPEAEIEAAVAGEPVAEAAIEEPVAEAAIEEPVAEAANEEPAGETATEEPAAEAATEEEPAVEAAAEEPAAEAAAEEPAAEAATEEPAAQAATEEPVAEPATEEEPAAQAATEEPVAEPATEEEPAAEAAAEEEPATPPEEKPGA